MLSPIISKYHTHATMDALFMAAGCPGEVPEGNKTAKAMQWLRSANSGCSQPLDVLGYVTADLLDPWAAKEPDDLDEECVRDRDRIVKVLGANGLSYRTGGRIFGAALTGPSRTLEDDIKARGIPAIEEEFQRAYTTIDTDPPSAVTGACAIVESVCKTYLDSVGEPLPSKQSIDPLWGPIRPGNLGCSEAEGGRRCA